MTNPAPLQVADVLVEAWASGQPQPVARAAALASPAEAYAVQALVAARMGWHRSDAPASWKSGGPAPGPTQTHARLPPAGVRRTPGNDQGLVARLRGIEAEIALRLGAEVTASRAAELAASGDLHTVSDLIDAMAPAIEVVESRWIEAQAAPALARLADLQSHGALVVGPWVAFDKRRDWSTQRCRVGLGSRAEQVFTGSHSMGHPAAVLAAWLAHATRDGSSVPAGTVVTTGTWCRLLTARAGETVTATFDGIGQAVMQFS